MTVPARVLRRGVLLGLLCLCGLAGWCSDWFRADEAVDVVAADCCRRMWVWPGRSRPDSAHPVEALYLLQGEFLGNSANRRRYMPVLEVASRQHAQQLWLVYRIESVEWTEAINRMIVRRAREWERAGNHVAGIQIDFDARSVELRHYSALLATIRRLLPSHYQLSVTGLMDWSSPLYRDELASVATVVDEMVFQTYQGRETVDHYLRYVDYLTGLQYPFRVGLVEGGRWESRADAVTTLERNPRFRGYVLFVLQRSVGKRQA